MVKRYLFLSDLHVPDENRELLDKILLLISENKFDRIYLMGDFINCVGISSYVVETSYKYTFNDEIQLARKVLRKIVRLARLSNPKVKITWFDGNHEHRILKFLAVNARAIADLELDDEQLISIPYLMGLKELGIEYVPYMESREIEGGVVLLHGDKVNKHAGYTAKNMIDELGLSCIFGHTHRQGYHSRLLGHNIVFGIETGCLCNLQPEPKYVRTPNWANGFVVATYSNNGFYPQLIPCFNNSFVFNNKVY